MKAKWGSCNHCAGSIRLNTDLARSRGNASNTLLFTRWLICSNRHYARFVALMDQFMPKWQSHRDTLNRLRSGMRAGTTDAANAGKGPRAVSNLVLSGLLPAGAFSVAGCQTRRTVPWRSREQGNRVKRVAADHSIRLHAVDHLDGLLYAHGLGIHIPMLLVSID